MRTRPAAAAGPLSPALSRGDAGESYLQSTVWPSCSVGLYPAHDRGTNSIPETETVAPSGSPSDLLASSPPAAKAANCRLTLRFPDPLNKLTCHCILLLITLTPLHPACGPLGPPACSQSFHFSFSLLFLLLSSCHETQQGPGESLRQRQGKEEQGRRPRSHTLQRRGVTAWVAQNSDAPGSVLSLGAA